MNNKPYQNALLTQTQKCPRWYDDGRASTTAYSPYTYIENFDSPELAGFAGPFVSYLYNVDDERVMKISPQGVTRYITDGNGQVLPFVFRLTVIGKQVFLKVTGIRVFPSPTSRTP